jgi:hypothetical protein
MELGGWYHAAGSFALDSPEYPTDRRLPGSPTSPGIVLNGQSFAPLGNKPHFLWRPTCSVITMLTELPGLLIPFVTTKKQALIKRT